MKQNVRAFLQTTAILLTFGIDAQAQPTCIADVPHGSTDSFLQAISFTSMLMDLS